jgi:hypothetical protein
MMVVDSIWPLNWLQVRRGPPADVDGYVVHVHDHADDVREQQERHHQKLDDHPTGAERTAVDDPAERGHRAGYDGERAEQHDLVDADPAAPLVGRAEAHHLLPPHLAQVVRAGAYPGPRQAVPGACRPAHRLILLDGGGMPYEVEPLPGRVTVVDPVVAQIPRGLDVGRGNHQGTSYPLVELGVGGQCAMAGVMGQDEQPTDAQAGQQPERQDEVPAVGERQSDEWQQVQHTGQRHPTEGSAGGAFVAIGRDHGAHGAQ